LPTTEGRGDAADDSAASASASSSRATSPSRSGPGKARGLGGSSPIGSPSAYRAAPAAAAAGASARGPAAASSAARGPSRTAGEAPPAYDEDEDEAIGLEDDDDDDDAPAAPPPPPDRLLSIAAPEWHWADLGTVVPRDDVDSGDADGEPDDAGSNEAADGDFDDDASGQERLLQDFGDDLVDAASLRFRHVAGPDVADEDDFMADDDADADAEPVDHVVGSRTMLIGDEDEEDVPVAEVRVDEGSDNGHMKMD